MAAGIAVASAKISGAVDYEKASIVVRRNRMVISVRGENVLTDESVTRVERLTARTWQVTADSGVYVIERAAGGCGCARG